MSLSPMTLIAPSTTSSAARSAQSDRVQQVAQLTKALYPADRQEKFLELQAEVETLFSQLQALQIRV
ncbi:hypothetical protein [Chamaesiphon sp. VAR_48_metabat_403]|uniref:hypothetical protein n=1 Tax=Chamaesiphon sp. VAR_48_metabat_403 TaxID=2964700 RepID=UPI00286E2C74|nr:hypothetical protein [Chamaesiphon sp. VAR_48_metabat_403]